MTLFKIKDRQPAFSEKSIYELIDTLDIGSKLTLIHTSIMQRPLLHDRMLPKFTLKGKTFVSL
jgi:hypothetical protein